MGFLYFCKGNNKIIIPTNTNNNDRYIVTAEYLHTFCIVLLQSSVGPGSQFLAESNALKIRFEIFGECQGTCSHICDPSTTDL